MIFSLITLLQAEGGGITALLPLFLMIPVVYFFMIRPQQKRQKEQQQFVESIKKGDNVVTQGGIMGKVSEIDGEIVTLDIGKSVKMQVKKSFISRDNTLVPETKK